MHEAHKQCKCLLCLNDVVLKNLLLSDVAGGLIVSADNLLDFHDKI